MKIDTRYRCIINPKVMHLYSFSVMKIKNPLHVCFPKGKNGTFSIQLSRSGKILGPGYNRRTTARKIWNNIVKAVKAGNYVEIDTPVKP